MGFGELHSGRHGLLFGAPLKMLPEQPANLSVLLLVKFVFPCLYFLYIPEPVPILA